MAEAFWWIIISLKRKNERKRNQCNERVIFFCEWACRFLTWYCRGYPLLPILSAIVWSVLWSLWALLSSSKHLSLLWMLLVRLLLSSFKTFEDSHFEVFLNTSIHVHGWDFFIIFFYRYRYSSCWCFLLFKGEAN